MKHNKKNFKTMNEMISAQLITKKNTTIKFSPKFRTLLLRNRKLPNLEKPEMYFIYSIIEMCPFLTTEKIANFMTVCNIMVNNLLMEKNKIG